MDPVISLITSTSHQPFSIPQYVFHTWTPSNSLEQDMPCHLRCLCLFLRAPPLQGTSSSGGPIGTPSTSTGTLSPGDQHYLQKAEPPAQPLTPIWPGLVTPNKCENATFAGRNPKEIGNLLLASFPLSSHVCCYFLTLFFFS